MIKIPVKKEPEKVRQKEREIWNNHEQLSDEAKKGLSERFGNLANANKPQPPQGRIIKENEPPVYKENDKSFWKRMKSKLKEWLK